MAGQVLDLTAILQQAQDPNEQRRIQAESQLNQFEEQDFPGFVLSLTTELANDSKPPESRILAGIVLKNKLDSKESLRRDELIQRWRQLDGSLKQQVKTMLLECLKSQSKDATRAAAQVISKVASIELRDKQWPELVQSLLNNMQAATSTTLLKQATLETFGFTCEELGGDEVLSQDDVNNVLTAVVQGMQRDEPDVDIRYAATHALLNALEFAHANFENPNERNYLMQVICEGTQSTDERVRTASFECLVRIAMDYYEHLRPYMTELFNITVKAARDDEEKVALQAVEFWCTIAEEEMEVKELLMEEGEETFPRLAFHNLIPTASPSLTPELLELMTRQEESQESDEDSWTLAMQAATCLTLVANVIQQPILQQVMPFIQDNIQKNGSEEDWHYREAATLAFGCILEGPDEKELLPIVQMGLPHFLTALGERNEHVRSTTAWTIGRIFDLLHYPESSVQVVSSTNVSSIMDALRGALADSVNLQGNIAEKVCFAVSRLAAGYQRGLPATDLSPHFESTAEALLTVTNQPYAVGSKLHIAAYEALNDLIRHCGDDCMGMVGHLVGIVLRRLAGTMQMEKNDALQEVQGQCCAVLQVSMQRLTYGGHRSEVVIGLADNIMQGLLEVLASRPGSINEEAMLAVGAMTYVQQGEFFRYMEQLWPFLETGIRNHMEWQTCKATVGVLGDIIRVLEGRFHQWADQAMQLLLANLQSASVNRYVKPTVLMTFGDMAQALGDDFQRYLPNVVQMLLGAMQLAVDQSSRSDDELAQFNNELRYAVLEASSRILMSLSNEVASQQLSDYAQHVVKFVGMVHQQQDATDQVTKAAVESLGDAAQKVRGIGNFIMQQQWLNAFFSKCGINPDSGIKQSADYAYRVIQHVTA